MARWSRSFQEIQVMKAKSWLVLAAVAIVALPLLSWNVASGEDKNVGGTKATGTGDEGAIQDVINAYYHGVVSANRGLIERAWDLENGQMEHLITRGPVERVGVVAASKAVDWWTRARAATSSSQILDMDIAEGKMAMVKFEFIFNQLYYLEYLTLFKVDGQWKIVNKSFISRKLED